MSDKKNTVDVVVLLAGEGRRLLPLTEDCPKGLLSCEDGLSIFEHTVRSVCKLNGSPVIMPVVGHGMDKVHEEIISLNSAAGFRCVYNPFYASAGPLISLWLGLNQAVSDKVIIINGDTLIKKSLVKQIDKWIFSEPEKEKPQLGVCVSRADDFHPDDMKVQLDENGAFEKASKDITPSHNVVKSAGVICVRDNNSKVLLKEKLDYLVMKEECVKRNYHWHNLLNESKDLFEFNLLEVPLDSWYEVDTIVDLDAISK